MVSNYSVLSVSNLDKELRKLCNNSSNVRGSCRAKQQLRDAIKNARTLVRTFWIATRERDTCVPKIWQKNRENCENLGQFSRLLQSQKYSRDAIQNVRALARTFGISARERDTCVSKTWQKNREKCENFEQFSRLLPSKRLEGRYSEWSSVSETILNSGPRYPWVQISPLGVISGNKGILFIRYPSPWYV